MSSPFFDVPSTEWVAQNRSGFAIRDLHPVSQGHTLIVPRRLISTWWEASEDERSDLMALLQEVKARLDDDYRPDGYNVGFNSGDAAGQTVQHLHLHVIPRWYGDVADPRGGVRAVLGGASGWDGMPPVPAGSAEASESRRLTQARVVDLLNGPTKGLHPALLDHLNDRTFDRIDLLVSFVMLSGLDLIGGGIEDAVDRGARVRVLTTDYLKITDAAALGWLLDRTSTGPPTETGKGSLEAKVFQDPTTSFHPKAYLFWSSTGDAGAAFVGSSNVSHSGLTTGIEWNVHTDEVKLMRVGFDHLWGDRRAQRLTEEWLSTYQPRRPPPSPGQPEGGEVEDGAVRESPPAADVGLDDADLTEPTPTDIQREALDALEATRAEGYSAGLVVMATGLGKTWLAAFDSARPSFRRVLFVAHRDEILQQSRDVFRRVRGAGSFGLFTGTERHPEADVVFASVQSLHRNLDKFDRDEFDYVVVDEFHHASASSYRRVLDHFRSKFLLGLTATPDRMDGADLLALCHDNLVFECNLVEGIDRSALVPFRYWGVPDIVDFAPIPWRNGQFDPDALDAAITTQERADHALREWEKRRGTRTLAFCASTRHADYMAAHFNAAGIRSAAVHSKPTSAPRAASLKSLTDGDLDVLFSVDVFNEGVDLPAVDTVLMLRPTASPIVFLQQLGRGLRLAEGKDHLRVIDFIGNHRSFLSKPRTLLSLGSPSTPTTSETLDALRTGDFRLPAGCSVDYDLDAIALLERIQPPATAGDLITDFVRSYTAEEGQRPTAAQTWRSGYDPTPVSKGAGWFGFLDRAGVLDDDEAQVLQRHAAFLREIETTPITKSDKLVALRAFLQEDGLRTRVSVDRLADAAQEIIAGDPRLTADVRSEEISSPADAPSDQWRRYWRRTPIAAWLGELKGTPSKWFDLDGNEFGVAVPVEAEDTDVLAAAIAEILEYRLARYLAGAVDSSDDEAKRIICRVGHKAGLPLIALDRRNHPNLPEGQVRFRAGGDWYEGSFKKDVLAVAFHATDSGNVLWALLRGWFGPSAGHPGTRHEVAVTHEHGVVTIEPAAVQVSLAGPQTAPLFPTLAVACGAFNEPSTVIHHASTIEVQPQSGVSIDRDRHFVAFARGDSMDGGEDPIRHGDPLLFEWARGVDRTDLIGQRVLVDYRNGRSATALKRLARVDGRFVLEPDNAGFPSIDGVKEMRIAARLVKKLDQDEVNPLSPHIGELVVRKQIRALHGDPEAKTNWQMGHVSLPGQAILLVTLDKADMPGVEYVDHFEDRSTMVWSSQASTRPEGKKGREVLQALETGTHLHLWVRPRKKDVGFVYCGLVVPVRHEGSKPMAVTFRLLTPLTTEMAHRFSLD